MVEKMLSSRFNDISSDNPDKQRSAHFSLNHLLQKLRQKEGFPERKALRTQDEIKELIRCLLKYTAYVPMSECHNLFNKYQSSKSNTRNWHWLILNYPSEFGVWDFLKTRTPSGGFGGEWSISSVTKYCEYIYKLITGKNAERGHILAFYIRLMYLAQGEPFTNDAVNELANKYEVELLQKKQKYKEKNLVLSLNPKLLLQLNLQDDFPHAGKSSKEADLLEITSVGLRNPPSKDFWLNSSLGLQNMKSSENFALTNGNPDETPTQIIKPEAESPKEKKPLIKFTKSLPPKRTKEKRVLTISTPNFIPRKKPNSGQLTFNQGSQVSGSGGNISNSNVSSTNKPSSSKEIAVSSSSGSHANLPQIVSVPRVKVNVNPLSFQSECIDRQQKGQLETTVENQEVTQVQRSTSTAVTETEMSLAPPVSSEIVVQPAEIQAQMQQSMSELSIFPADSGILSVFKDTVRLASERKEELNAKREMVKVKEAELKAEKEELEKLEKASARVLSDEKIVMAVMAQFAFFKALSQQRSQFLGVENNPESGSKRQNLADIDEVD